ALAAGTWAAVFATRADAATRKAMRDAEERHDQEVRPRLEPVGVPPGYWRLMTSVSRLPTGEEPHQCLHSLFNRTTKSSSPAEALMSTRGSLSISSGSANSPTRQAPSVRLSLSHRIVMDGGGTAPCSTSWPAGSLRGRCALGSTADWLNEVSRICSMANSPGACSTIGAGTRSRN